MFSLKRKVKMGRKRNPKRGKKFVAKKQKSDKDAIQKKEKDGEKVSCIPPTNKTSSSQMTFSIDNNSKETILSVDTIDAKPLNMLLEGVHESDITETLEMTIDIEDIKQEPLDYYSDKSLSDSYINQTSEDLYSCKEVEFEYTTEKCTIVPVEKVNDVVDEIKLSQCSKKSNSATSVTMSDKYNAYDYSSDYLNVDQIKSEKTEIYDYTLQLCCKDESYLDVQCASERIDKIPVLRQARKTKRQDFNLCSKITDFNNSREDINSLSNSCANVDFLQTCSTDTACLNAEHSSCLSIKIKEESTEHDTKVEIVNSTSVNRLNVENICTHVKNKTSLNSNCSACKIITGDAHNLKPYLSADALDCVKDNNARCHMPNKMGSSNFVKNIDILNKSIVNKGTVETDNECKILAISNEPEKTPNVHFFPNDFKTVMPMFNAMTKTEPSNGKSEGNSKSRWLSQNSVGVNQETSKNSTGNFFNNSSQLSIIENKDNLINVFDSNLHNELQHKTVSSCKESICIEVERGLVSNIDNICDVDKLKHDKKTYDFSSKKCSDKKEYSFIDLHNTESQTAFSGLSCKTVNMVENISSLQQSKKQMHNCLPNSSSCINKNSHIPVGVPREGSPKLHLYTEFNTPKLNKTLSSETLTEILTSASNLELPTKYILPMPKPEKASLKWSTSKISKKNLHKKSFNPPSNDFLRDILNFVKKGEAVKSSNEQKSNTYLDAKPECWTRLVHQTEVMNSDMTSSESSQFRNITSIRPKAFNEGICTKTNEAGVVFSRQDPPCRKFSSFENEKDSTFGNCIIKEKLDIQAEENTSMEDDDWQFILEGLDEVCSDAPKETSKHENLKIIATGMENLFMMANKKNVTDLKIVDIPSISNEERNYSNHETFICKTIISKSPVSNWHDINQHLLVSDEQEQTQNCVTLIDEGKKVIRENGKKNTLSIQDLSSTQQKGVCNSEVEKSIQEEKKKEKSTQKLCASDDILQKCVSITSQKMIGKCKNAKKYNKGKKKKVKIKQSFESESVNLWQTDCDSVPNTAKGMECCENKSVECSNVVSTKKSIENLGKKTSLREKLESSIEQVFQLSGKSLLDIKTKEKVFKKTEIKEKERKRKKSSSDKPQSINKDDCVLFDVENDPDLVSAKKSSKLQRFASRSTFLISDVMPNNKAPKSSTKNKKCGLSSAKFHNITEGHLLVKSPHIEIPKEDRPADVYNIMQDRNLWNLPLLNQIPGGEKVVIKDYKAMLGKFLNINVPENSENESSEKGSNRSRVSRNECSKSINSTSAADNRVLNMLNINISESPAVDNMCNSSAFSTDYVHKSMDTTHSYPFYDQSLNFHYIPPNICHPPSNIPHSPINMRFPPPSMISQTLPCSKSQSCSKQYHSFPNCFDWNFHQPMRATFYSRIPVPPLLLLPPPPPPPPVTLLSPNLGPHLPSSLLPPPPSSSSSPPPPLPPEYPQPPLPPEHPQPPLPPEYPQPPLPPEYPQPPLPPDYPPPPFPPEYLPPLLPTSYTPPPDSQIAQMYADTSTNNNLFMTHSHLSANHVPAYQTDTAKPLQSQLVSSTVSKDSLSTLNSFFPHFAHRSSDLSSSCATVNSTTKESSKLDHCISPAVNSTNENGTLKISEFGHEKLKHGDHCKAELETLGLTSKYSEDELMTSEDFLTKILSWSVDWLVEQCNQSEPPPIVKKLRFAFSAYIGFESYYCTYVPMLLCETWEALFQTWRGKKYLQNYYFLITSYTKRKTMVEINCETFINNDGSCVSQPTEGYLVFMKFALLCKSGVKMFGYISHHTLRAYNEDLDSNHKLHQHYALHCFDKNSKVLSLTLKTFWECKEIDLNQLVRIQMLFYLKPVLKQYDALLNVKYSPLCHSILSPDPSTCLVFSLSKSDMNRIAAILSEIASNISKPHPQIIVIQSSEEDVDKTNILVALIQHLKALENVDHKALLLLCSNSSRRVDEIGCHLINTPVSASNSNCKLHCVRLGKDVNMHSEMKKITFKYLVTKCMEKIWNQDLEVPMQECKDAAQKVAECETSICTLMTCSPVLAKKLKKELKKCQEMHREKLRIQECLIAKHRRNHAQYLLEAQLNVLQSCDVILSSVCSCHEAVVDKILRSKRSLPTTCIIDNANQCTELEVLTPLLYGVSKLILIGDPNVPAKVLSKYASNNNSDLSLFKRILSSVP